MPEFCSGRPAVLQAGNPTRYELAVELYKLCQTIKAPPYVRDQLLRAALSIACNLGEGSGKSSPKDRARFYSIALGSLREVQVILKLHGNQQAIAMADRTGASIYRLVKALEHAA